MNNEVIVDVLTKDPRQQQFYIVNMQSGTKRKLGDPIIGKENFFWDITLHPKNDRIAYYLYSNKTDLWSLENY